MIIIIGDLIYIVSAASLGLTASVLAEMLSWSPNSLPDIDTINAAHMYKHLHAAIKAGLVKSAHDLSEGGLGVALSESCIGSGLGAMILTHRMSSAAAACIREEDPLKREMLTRLDFALFAEGPARLLLSIDPKDREAFEEQMSAFSCIELGRVSSDSKLRFINAEQNEVFAVEISELLQAWETLLPFD
ncbi:MAG: hypothetical protein K2X27_17320 [Candidatus Obscuribacterales bacterium]|nr:hypothetical protein [Candidatus Obscuribacterales bacterium]